MAEAEIAKNSATSESSDSDKTKGKRSKNSPPGGRSVKRKEQKRSIETRVSILEAALVEFAENGFEGASMRTIGERTGAHYTLITYHFRNKETLWRATAEHFFNQIGLPSNEISESDEVDAIDVVRHQFHSFFKFIVGNPDFHRFMMRENAPNNPRLVWLIDHYLAPILNPLIGLIETAQNDGDLPDTNPVLLYYLLVGATTALSGSGAEIKYQTGMNPRDADVADQYWALIERMLFKRHLYGST